MTPLATQPPTGHAARGGKPPPARRPSAWRRLCEWAGSEDGAAYSDRRLHASFLLFVSGALLVLAALALVAWGQAYPADASQSMMRYWMRQTAGIAGGLGVCALFLGMLSALYTRAYMRWLGLAASATALAGVLGFAYAYPFAWGVPGQTDWSIPVSLALGVSLAVLIGTTFAAVASNVILRTQARGRLRAELGREPTDDEIERDIDDALRRYRFTWGGLAEGQDASRGLRIRDDPLPPEWQAMGWKLGRDEERADTTALDAAHRQLDAFRGGRLRHGELALGNLDASANALQALRAERSAKEAARPWNRFKAWLRRLFDRAFHRQAAH
ncbi:MAG TPA: hypothetical protein VM681_03885 [Candidatus Thermoplasmatota archaeon]|nr:hypothetical protein [Candidatus Thermoplasmatota archaeon]